MVSPPESKLKGKSSIPPRQAQKLLQRILRDDLAEEVLGDLEERFFLALKTKSSWQAKLGYWFEVLNYLRPFAMRQSNSRLNQSDMFQNYFKMGWRNMMRQKMYSFIKIGGFALGIAACLLIMLYVNHEWSFDKHYPDADRIYRVVGVNNDNGDMKRGVPFPAPMANAIKEDYPEVALAGRYLSSELFGAGSNEVRPADQQDSYYDQGFVYFDQELIDILQLPFLEGNPQRALQTPQAIVITQHIARKYFGNESPIGKELIINNNGDKPYQITGVIEDFPATSHLQFNFLITTYGLEFWKSEQKDWGASNYTVYIKLKPGVDAQVFQQKMSKGIIDKYVVPMLLSSGMSLSDTQKLFSKAWLELQPLPDIYLHSTDIEDGDALRGDIRMVWIFSGIAILIVLIAAINFINLSTAKAANRAKEVGLRKVSGSHRRQIITQFLTESVLFSVISFALALALALLVLPYFNELSGKALSINWKQWWLVPALVGSSLVIGILAGMYPSFYLSSFQPIQVLKGQLAKGSKGAMLRSGLVVFQFTTSIVLILGTLVIYQQMRFVLNKKIGFDKEQILLIEGAGTLKNQIGALKEELRALPGVQHASVSDYLPVKGTKRNGNSFWHEGKVQSEPGIIAQKWLVDHDYIKTLAINVVAGRDFNSSMSTDSSACIINQAMMRQLGDEDLLGKRISNEGETFLVIGVVEDFHFENMRNAIEPMCLVLGNSPGIVAVKVSSGEMTTIIRDAERVWKKFAPHQLFRFTFLDDRYAAMYADVQRTGKIVTSFAALAIVIACLGLFALSAFMIEQRTKEIGIRLVLGASVSSVFRLLTGNFLVLVIISILVAVPIAWFLMQRWLQDFAYRIDLGAEIFVLSGVAAILVALFTISYQSWRAGLAQPVDSLRSE